MERAASVSNASQARSAALAEKALEAQANISVVAAKAADNLAKAKEKAIAAEAKYSAELNKSRAALSASIAAANNVAVPAAASKAVDKASAQIKKDELAVTKAEDAAEKALASTRLSTYTAAQVLQQKLLTQRGLLKKAEEDAAIVSRRTANTIISVPDTVKGAIDADVARLKEARALEKVADLKRGATQIEKDYNKALVDGGKAAALAEEAGADAIAAASSKVVASKQQLAQAVTAANAAQGASAEAAREIEYAAASKSAQADAALASSRIASENAVVATTQRGKTEIAAAHADSAAANKASAAASADATAKATQMSGLMKTGLMAAAVAGLATAAVITKVGFSYNSTKESATAAFTGIIKDGPRATAFMNELYGWTRKTSLGFDTAVHSAQEFLARGIKLDQVIPIMDTIAEAAAKIPAPMEQTMQRISYAIGQISQSAKLHSQDIRQLTEAGIDAWRYLSEATGASIDDMQKDAEKFGLTGAHVAEIILAGMRKDSAGMLQIQAQTGRGQIAIAQRNFSELAGIFTKPFYEGFVQSLKVINDILANPGVKAFAQEWGENIAAGIAVPFNAAKELKKLLDSITVPDINVKLPVVGNTNSLPKTLLKGLNEGAQLAFLPTALNKYAGYAGLNKGPSTSQDKIDDLLDKRNNLSKLMASYEAGSKGANELASSIASVDSDIEMYRKVIEGSGNAAGNAAGKILSATASMEGSWQKMATIAKAGIEKTRSELEDVMKTSGHDTLEGTQAQYNVEKYKVDTQPRVDFLQQGIKDLDRESRHAAEATRIASEAKSDEIKAVQRNIDERDRIEQRRDMVESFALSGSEKAAKALDEFDRATQRATLSQTKSASDKLQEQFDAEDRASSRKDLQEALHDAHGRKDRRKAQEAIDKFDLDSARKIQLQGLKDQEERQKNAQTLARMDKEDQIKKLKEAEDKKQQSKELTRFDRSTKEGKQMQALQDQAEAISRAGEATQRAIEKRKEIAQDELTGIEDQKNKLQSISDNYDIAVKNAILLAKLADPEKLPKQEELLTTINGIVDSFKKFYQDLKDALKIGADIQSAKVQKEINEPPASFNLPGRALGGYVEANKAYVVGENQAEIFVPSSSGYISKSLADYARNFANKTWPSDSKMIRGEVGAALDGLYGYLHHMKLSQDWIDAYLPYVRQLEQQQQQQNRVTAVGSGSGNGGSSTVNNNNRTLHNLGPININMGNNQNPRDSLDYIFQKM